jgi:hypothetical protein
MISILKEFGPLGALGLLAGLILIAVIQPKTAGGAVLLLMLPVLAAVAIWTPAKAIRDWLRK